MQSNIKNPPPKNPFFSIFHNDNPTIVFTGRLNSTKRLDMLIEALFELKTDGYPINCFIIGDGTERSNLERNTRKYNLEDTIVFYGECYDESIIGLMYWNAALCVCPGSIGLTAIHAMTYGCPVLTHNNFSEQHPEFEAIQPDISGDFFIYNNINSLKLYIKKWVSISKEQRVICNQNCRNIIKKEWTPSYQIEVIRIALSPSI